MKDVLATIHAVRRPGLLIRAARIGAAQYRRTNHLIRLIGAMPPASSGAALDQLIELEAEIDSQRKNEQAEYSPARHVEILIAMMGEARLFREARHP
ncbi:hypothetical protein FDP25_01820 [Roseovarius sp. A21]|uniref:Uncharacterized protein n=1 Tax=Roseovarius bejariae TaxID=2576383 RepID=A0A844CHP1_9RHOB|nr:DUF6477 family protein [Roseovarius bejariae]MRU14157.1 hypothetical protein [Roseovarius bejariae]